MSRRKWVIRGLVLVWFAVSMFFGYGGIRAWEQFGFEPGMAVISAVVGALFGSGLPAPHMVIVLAMVVVMLIVDMRRPECRFQLHVPGARCCGGCGYPAAGLAEENCPECGGKHFVKTRRVQLPSRGLVIAATLGWAVGAAASEAWILFDEWSFRQEAAASGQTSYSRARCWPNRDSGLVFQGGGFRGTD